MFCVALAVFLGVHIARVPRSAVALITLVSTLFFSFVPSAGCLLWGPALSIPCWAARLIGSVRLRVHAVFFDGLSGLSVPLSSAAAWCAAVRVFGLPDRCSFAAVRVCVPSIQLLYRCWRSPLSTVSSAVALVLASVAVVFAAATALAASTLALPDSVLAAFPPALDSALSSALVATAVVAGAAAALAAFAPATLYLFWGLGFALSPHVHPISGLPLGVLCTRLCTGKKTPGGAPDTHATRDTHAGTWITQTNLYSVKPKLRLCPVRG